MCQTVSEQGRLLRTPPHDSDLASGDGIHGTGDLSLAVETNRNTLFCLWREEDRDGILNWIGMDWEIPKEPMLAVCTAPFRFCMPHLDIE